MFFDVFCSIVLKDLVKSILSRSENFGDSWNAMRDQLLVIYREALSSDCGDIIQIIQVHTLTSLLYKLFFS